MVLKRNTIQKKRILEYLYSVKTHPTAEKIYDEVKKSLPSISLATVYRNLNQMVDDKKVLKLEINGEFHFDADISNHQHFFCTKCNRLIDVFDDELQKIAFDHIDKSKFDVEYISITFKGVCEECKSQLNK